MIYSVEFNGKKMNYIKFGSGKKILVMLPGMSVSYVTESESAIKSAYSDFCEDFTVYLFDRTSNMPSYYKIKDMATDTAEAMKTLSLKNAYLFGVSQGGMIAQVLAAYYPELVKKAVLGSTLSKQNEISADTFNTWIKLAKSGNRADLNNDCAKRVYSKEYYNKYKSIFELTADPGTDEQIKRYEILSKASLEFDFYGELDKIKCPVLVIGSYLDRVLSGIGSIEIAQKLSCEIFMYDGYSHAVYDEAPDYKEKVYDFFIA
ncbi:MAG: alpha/beta hydrolase [Clostridia bacterium]|nr:alpha/beta hydrolase [Clostridia bacterium]